MRHSRAIRFAAALALIAAGLPAHSADGANAKVAPPPAPAAAPAMPFNFQMPPTRPKENNVPNTIAESISAEARANFVGSVMSMNQFSLRDMIAMMVVKYPAKEGLKYDEVVDAMKLKANEINFKFVGHNPLWKDVIAVTGKTDTPRVEFFTFCDSVVAREILDLSLEFAAFLPCRVAVVEDAYKKIWLITLDWDVRWLDSSKNPNQMSASLREKAIGVREAIDQIMKAGAAGEF